MPDERMVSSGPCVEPEVLAAYVDRRLTPEEKASVDAHLAACGDCYAVLTEVMRTSDEMDGRVAEFAPPEVHNASRAKVVRPRFGSRRTWTIAGGLLATAAALVLFVRTQTNWRSSDEHVHLARLAAAAGPDRPFESRLTGGFAYAPVRSNVRSSESSLATDNPRAVAAVAAAEQHVARTPTPPNLHVLARGYALIGRADDAAALLQKVAEQTPEDATVRSDICALLIARRANDGARRAVSECDAAIRLNARLPEALFNRALALEILGRRDDAVEAWRAYLTQDPSGPWASEARAHVQALERK